MPLEHIAPGNRAGGRGVYWRMRIPIRALPPSVALAAFLSMPGLAGADAARCGFGDAGDRAPAPPVAEAGEAEDRIDPPGERMTGGSRGNGAVPAAEILRKAGFEPTPKGAAAFLRGALAPGGGAAAAPAAPDEDRIRELIAALGNDAFAVREGADGELRRIGAPALPILRESAASADAEVRARAAAIIAFIEAPGPPPGAVHDAAIEVLYTQSMAGGGFGPDQVEAALGYFPRFAGTDAGSSQSKRFLLSYLRYAAERCEEIDRDQRLRTAAFLAATALDEDEPANVRSTATMYLAALAGPLGSPAGGDPEAWRAWLEAEGRKAPGAGGPAAP